MKEFGVTKKQMIDEDAAVISMNLYILNEINKHERDQTRKLKNKRGH